MDWESKFSGGGQMQLINNIRYGKAQGCMFGHLVCVDKNKF